MAIFELIGIQESELRIKNKAAMKGVHFSKIDRVASSAKVPAEVYPRPDWGEYDKNG